VIRESNPDLAESRRNTCAWIRGGAFRLRHKLEIIARRVGSPNSESPIIRQEPFGVTMALTFSLVGTWDDDKRIHMIGKGAGSGNYSGSGEGQRISVERPKVSLLLAFARLRIRRSIPDPIWVHLQADISGSNLTRTSSASIDDRMGLDISCRMQHYNAANEYYVYITLDSRFLQRLRLY
jgi:hypothetical protein